MKKAGQQREAENADFQQVVSDQRATQTILQKALAKLKDFYEKKIGDKSTLLQTAQEPPVGTKTRASEISSVRPGRHMRRVRPTGSDSGRFCRERTCIGRTLGAHTPAAHSGPARHHLWL